MTDAPVQGRTAPPAHLILLGAAGGFLSGLFGVGGGVILVPGLVLLLAMDQRRANATSLLAIIPIAITGAAGYALAGEVDVLDGMVLASTGIFGSVFGARLLPRIPLVWLRRAMAALLVVTAVRLALPAPDAAMIEHGRLLLVPIGFLAGMIAGTLGVGGGIIMVPAMVLLTGASADVARGTSLLVVIISATAGSISHIRAGRSDVRVGLTLGIAGMPGAVAGVALAQTIPERTALVLFGVLLVFSAIQLLRRSEDKR